MKLIQWLKERWRVATYIPSPELRVLFARVREVSPGAADYLASAEWVTLRGANPTEATLWSLFIWQDSPQGNDYWLDIATAIGEDGPL